MYVCALTPQAEELSKAVAVDGGLSELLSRVCEGSIVLGGDGGGVGGGEGLKADLEYDRLAAAGGYAGVFVSGLHKCRTGCGRAHATLQRLVVLCCALSLCCGV